MHEKMKTSLFSIILIFLTPIAIGPFECVQGDFILPDASPDLFAIHEHSGSSHLPSCQIVSSTAEGLRISDQSEWIPIETAWSAAPSEIALSTVLCC